MNKGITILLLLVVLGAMGMVMVSHISSRDETTSVAASKPSATQPNAPGAVAGKPLAPSRETSVSDLIRIDPPLSSLNPRQQRPEGAPREVVLTPNAQPAKPPSGGQTLPSAASQPASNSGTKPDKAPSQRAAGAENRQETQQTPQGYRQTPQAPADTPSAGQALREAPPRSSGAITAIGTASPLQSAQPAKDGTQERASAGSQDPTAAGTVRADAAGPQGRTAPVSTASAEDAEARKQTVAPAGSAKADVSQPQEQTATHTDAGAARRQGQAATPASAEAVRPPELVSPPAPVSGKQPDANQATLSEKGTHSLKNISLLFSGDEVILRIEADNAFPCKTFV
ncbi:MAG: hypothetical protein LBS65_00605, partial [Desulfovibrio sp.]|nr:hypothetical protein [Desulfovibrio sp.]